MPACQPARCVGGWRWRQATYRVAVVKHYAHNVGVATHKAERSRGGLVSLRLHVKLCRTPSRVHPGMTRPPQHDSHVRGDAQMEAVAHSSRGARQTRGTHVLSRSKAWTPPHVRRCCRRRRAPNAPKRVGGVPHANDPGMVRVPLAC